MKLVACLVLQLVAAQVENNGLGVFRQGRNRAFVLRIQPLGVLTHAGGNP